MSSFETRLQRHARKFRNCADPELVLRRYVAKCETMDRKRLLRHMSHVCAWIALAQPVTDAAVRTGDENLSPVRLLSKMLGMSGCKELDARLRAALEAVRSCCDVALRSGSCHHKKDWLDLRNCLPRIHKSTRNEADNSIVQVCYDPCLPAEMAEPTSGKTDVTTEDVLALNRVRRLNRGICQWRNHEHAEKQSFVCSISRQLADILRDGHTDTVLLRKLLYKAAGAVSPPRAKARPTDADHIAPLDEHAAELLRKSALVQESVRNILIAGLLAWRIHLQLEDLQIEPILYHLRHLVQEFETQHASVHNARAGDQWNELKHAVGLVGNGSVSHNVNNANMVSKRTRSEEGVNNVAPQGQSKKRRVNSLVEHDYRPSDVVQTLDTVVQGEVRQIYCESCGGTMSASFYFQHPRKCDKKLLVPCNGCRTCRHREGNREVFANFKAADGYQCIKDLWRNLKFCQHGNRSTDCDKCGGENACPHHKLKRNCKLCSEAKLGIGRSNATVSI